MSAMSSSSTPQARRSAAKSRLRQRRQVGDQRLHRRIVAVALDELQRQAFGEVAGEDAGRLEALQRASTASTRASGAPSRSAIVLQRRGEVAGFVERVDQRRGDHAVDGIGEDDHRLAGQVLGKARRRGDIGLEVGRLLVEAARRRSRSTRSPTGPGPRRRAPVRPASAAGRARRRCRSRCRDCAPAPSGSDSSVSVAQSPGVGRRRRLRRRLAAGRRRVEDRQLVGALQQRIALQFGLDEGGELGVGHLQQLDRLQQLRRQHHRLALPHRQSVRQRHPQPPLFDCRPSAPPRRGVLFAYTHAMARKKASPAALSPAPLTSQRAPRRHRRPSHIKTCLYLYCDPAADLLVSRPDIPDTSQQGRPHEQSRRLRRRRPRPRRVRPQGNRHRRDRDAGPDGDARRIRRRAAAEGRAHRRLAAHDDPDRGADRDAEGARRRRALGLVQHLFDPGPRRRGDRRRRHAGVRDQGREPEGLLGLHPPHLRMGRRRLRPT